MEDLCNLQIHVNGQHTFFVNEEIISRFSGKLRKIINQEKSRTTQSTIPTIEIPDFPGGPDGFELVSKFCHNNGRIRITVANVSLLHCCALFLGMTEKVSSLSPNLFQQTEDFLEGMFYWSWNDIITCLKSCESFFSYADSSSDLVQKLMNSLLGKIAQNSDINALIASSSSPSTSSSSPDTPASSVSRSNSGRKSTWWFNDLTILPPQIIESFVKTLSGYGSDNSSLLITRFLLHYLKSAAVNQCKKGISKSDQGYFGNIADTAVHGVILMGKSSFSCRGLFSVLRVVGSFGINKESRGRLERMIGGALHEAKLDDLLVSSGHNHRGGGGGGVYDVKLVVRLIRVFVHDHHQNQNHDHKLHEKVMKMKKVGRLIDDYLGEIAPDHSLKVSKFLGVAESLPDFARDCFDGVYRAIDVYIESHPNLSVEERTRICRCLNYKKLSLAACKDLAKNPRIPPRVAVQALASQHPNIMTNMPPKTESSFIDQPNHHLHYNDAAESCTPEEEEEGSEDMRLNLQRMQWRVVELERECREMKGQMSRVVKTAIAPSAAAYCNRAALPRLLKFFPSP